MILLRCVDLETTGLALPECILEIGWADVLFDPPSKATTVNGPRSELFVPTRPISPENRAVHHLTDAELATRPICTSDRLAEILRADAPFAFVAANAAFEKQWLTPEIAGEAFWICTVKAAARLFPFAESHSNQAIRYRLALELGEEAMPPHRAAPDAYVTAHILAAMLKTVSVRELVGWEREPRHLATCPIGKWRGKVWNEIEDSYLDWLLKTPDMDPDIQHAARLELARRQP